MTSIKEFTLKGLVPAVFTPMTKDGELNLDIIPSYGKYLHDNGIKSIFVNGTTGEGTSLTLEERKKVAEAWMANKKHGLQHVIVHIGGGNIKESKELAKHASELKVDAIGMMPSTFIKPISVEALVEYSRQVAACAPSIPFYYYHIPAMTQVEFSMVEYMKGVEKAVPTFRGIKYSSVNLIEASLCYNYNNCKYNILYGVDEDLAETKSRDILLRMGWQLLPALSLGIDAAIGSTYNFLPKLNLRIIDAKVKGDMEFARLEQLKAQKILRAAFKYASTYGHLPLQKFLMCMLTPVDVGPPRLPLILLEAEKIAAVKKDLSDLGYMDLIK